MTNSEMAKQLAALAESHNDLVNKHMDSIQARILPADVREMVKSQSSLTKALANLVCNIATGVDL